MRHKSSKKYKATFVMSLGAMKFNKTQTELLSQ